MHTVELLQEALEAARGLGFEVRQDWLGGNGGGHCLVRGRKMVLLDIAQSSRGATYVVAEALRGEPGAARFVRSSELAAQAATAPHCGIAAKSGRRGDGRGGDAMFARLSTLPLSHSCLVLALLSACYAIGNPLEVAGMRTFSWSTAS